MGLFNKSKKIDRRKIFTVRGIDFEYIGSRVPLSDLPQLYLVFKALDGDSLACELLNVTGTKINNAAGDIIYPPQNMKTK